MDNEKKGFSKYKKAWLNALLAIIPGAGQVRNRQWYKAIVLWIALILVVVVEFTSASYGKFEAEKDIYIPENHIQVKINYQSSINMLPHEDSPEFKDEWVSTKPIIDIVNQLSTVEGLEEYFEVDELERIVAEEYNITLAEAAVKVRASNVNTPGVSASHKEHYIEQSTTSVSTTCFKADGTKIDCSEPGATNTYVTGVWANLRLYSYNMSKNSSEARTAGEIRYYKTVEQKLENLNEIINNFNKDVETNNAQKNVKQPLLKLEVRALKYSQASFYYYRDYGGFFTKGVWGLSTLGKVKDLDEYRGVISNSVIKQDRNYPFENIEPEWTRFDVSQYLMALGLLATVIIVIVILIYAWTIYDAYKVQKKYIDGEPHLPFKEYFKKVFDSMFAYIILIPAICLIVCFTLIPMLFSLLIAFTNYSYASGTITAGTLFSWDGFNAFLTIVKDKDVLGFFLDVLLWTVIWAFCTSFTVYAMGFVNALIVESKAVSGIKIYLKNGKCISFFGKKFWRTIMILPWAIPGMITLMSAKNIFDVNGPVNQILSDNNLSQTVANFLHSIGLTEHKKPIIEWLGASNGDNANLAKVVLIIVNLWLGSPYHMMLIIGVLATISPELYEAADIDGASSFQKFRYITLPQVLISTLPSIIMTFSHNFNNFGAIYFLTGGGPARKGYFGAAGVPGKTDILISWIYKLTFTENQQYYNRGAIYSILIFLGIGLASVWNMSRTKMMQEEE